MESKFNPLRKFLEDDRHIHPFVILSVDILIVFISFSLAYLIIGGFGFDQIDFVQYLIVTACICLIALPVIYFSKLHTGLLRYSNIADLFRIFLATIIFSLLFILFFFGLGHRWIALNYSFLMLVMLVNYFITSTLLIAFRLLAKSTYLSLANKFSNKAVHKVLIFGADQNAVLVKQALSNDPDLNYVVEGFLSSDRTMLNNYLEQKKVYHMKDLPKLKKQKDIKELLITNENLNQREKRVVIERCIRLGIKVLTIPAAKNWLSGELSSKQIKKLRIEDLLQRKPIVIDQRKVKSDLEGKKVLVTGAAGSIGSEIVRQVLTYKPSLLILCDHAESPLHDVQLAMEDEFPDAKMEVVLADVSNYERMHKLFNVCRPQIVYHAAAYKHVPMIENNPFEAISVNVGGTRNIADLAVFFKVDKFVMVSTDKAVNPTNVMGASKRLAEIYTQSLNGIETCNTK
ncbi:MAG: polysaccharide biosynthesis protein, partial [Cytophagales bacterium]|nr:polysaccharide biosynthesis protein [Cytophagales bacterium]